MAKNVLGAKFVSNGIEYVLQYGPNGNLRPYTVGRTKTPLPGGNTYRFFKNIKNLPIREFMKSLSPITLPLKTVLKIRHPYILGATIVFAAVGATCFWAYKKYGNRETLE